MPTFAKDNSRIEEPAVPHDASERDDSRTPTGSAHEDAFSGSSESLSEVAQAKIRNWIHFALLFLAIIAIQFDPNISVQNLIYTTFTAIPAGFILYFWAIRLPRDRAQYKWRIAQRATSMVVDICFITWCLHFGGITFAGMFALYIWISVGYGIRYGLNYLYATLSLSVVMFGIGAWYTPFWHQNPGLVAGMMFGLIIVPAYTGWLIRQLQKAVAEKDVAYRAKSDFVAMMSHELRTPLHGIISTSDLLRSTATSPKQKEMIRIISTSSNSLLELINRVLDISKFESQSISLQHEPMDLHAVVNDTANILWPQAVQKGLSLQVYIDPEIHNSLMGAPHQLQEVLINLTGNAVKFTETGYVSVRVLHKYETEENVGVRFEISDTGPGIPKSALANIFEPFSQADSATTRKHGGTGLGTAFAKELIRLMGGTINVESTEGVGTKFTIDVELMKLRESEDVAQLYPFAVAGLGFKDTADDLGGALAQFGSRLSSFDSVAELASFGSEDGQNQYPDAIFVNADEYADNLGGIVRSITSLMPDRMVPLFACGSDLYKSSAISSGYSAFIPQFEDSQLVGRSLNMISALRHDVADLSSGDAETVTNLHILVAEDNPTNQKIARMVLEEAGHRCTIVSNGDEALDALHEGQFDLAILDMHMPHRDGIEVAKIYNFSHFEEDSRIPLIMMTADSRSEAQADAYASGIDAFVTKPITPARLIEVIASVSAKEKLNTDIEQLGAEPFGPEAPKAAEDDNVDAEVLEQQDAECLNDTMFRELVSYMEEGERRSFFEDFIADGSAYIKTLIECQDVGQVQTIREAMHAFAGACAVIGADELAGKAKAIEMADSTEIMQSHTDMHDGIMSTFAKTTEQLRTYY